MADQASITSILQALAAQQQRSAPPALQPPQSLYPGQPAPSGSYASPVPYGLPQPITSGSVDLSNIKPVNSGTVSIADAIAKAKAIATQNGISPYDRPMTYGNNDPHRAYNARGRSRSPPARRDAYRDMQNPYQDDRRADRGSTRDYRERDYSPGPRGRPFSPPQRNVEGRYHFRELTPVRGQDENSETISIESNLVGLIIGRQGENLRRVESECSCRVQFITGPEENGPYRQCRISGTHARRNEAKAEINRIIVDSGLVSGRMTNDTSRDSAANARGASHQPALRDGEDSTQIMVPDRTVGLIIGRGGETIRDLQERSGCHVNIVSEQKSVNGLRPVNLIGSREAAKLAKDLILEIVESDSKNGGSKDRQPAQQQTGSGGDKDSIFVPSDAVGMIIGKGGETIKDMQNSTGCKINVSPSSGPQEIEREIGLVGSRDAIAAARRAIEDKVEAAQAKSGGRSRGRNDYNDSGPNYSQDQKPASSSAPSGGAPADPYAVYGGYEAYCQLWYQSLAAQGQGAPAQGQNQTPPASKPPGTA